MFSRQAAGRPLDGDVAEDQSRDWACSLPRRERANRRCGIRVAGIDGSRGRCAAMATMVLVRGAWDGGFCWDDVVPHVQERGHRPVVIDRLPSAAADPADVGGFADDVAVVRAALYEAGSDVVLVGHSYGAMVITEVADHPAIVYVAAFWPPAGMSLLDLVGDAPPVDWFFPTDDGVLALGDFDSVHRAVAADVARAAFMPIVDNMGVQSLATFSTPSSAPPRSHPTTYVICTQDRAIAPDAQERMARAADDVIRLDSAHCPMFSMVWANRRSVPRPPLRSGRCRPA